MRATGCCRPPASYLIEMHVVILSSVWLVWRIFLLLVVANLWAVGNGYVGRWLGFFVGPVQNSFFFGLSKMTVEGGDAVQF